MSEENNYACCPSHCCAKHGCKYGLEGCPVVAGTAQQEYPCEECDYDRAQVQAHAHQMVIDRTELLRVLNENRHQAAHIKSLQGALTLKEEQLRAHRRVPLTAEQRAGLLADLDATTRRVQQGYNLPTAEGLSDSLERDLVDKTRSILADSAVK